MGKKNCADITFKEYIYFQYGLWPKDVDDNSFSIIQSSMEEPICSNHVSTKEEKESRKEDAAKTYVGPSIMRFFGCSPRRLAKGCKIPSKEKQDPLTKIPSKEKVMNLIEEETCSASNGSIYEEKEEGHVGLNILDRKDEEEDEGPKPFSIMEKGLLSIISSSDEGK